MTIAVHMGKNLLYTKFAEDMVMYILFGGGTFPAISGFIKYKIDLEKNMEYQWDTVCLLYTSLCCTYVTQLSKLFFNLYSFLSETFVFKMDFPVICLFLHAAGFGRCV